MSIPVLDAEITPAQRTDIENAITTIKTTLEAVATVNLTKDERQSLNSIDDDRLQYVVAGMQHAQNNPNLQPSFRDIADAQKDAELAVNTNELLPLLKQVVEMLEDLGLLAEHETYEYFLDFYANVQQAAKRNVPGVDTILDDISPAFEGQGGFLNEDEPEPSDPDA